MTAQVKSKCTRSKERNAQNGKEAGNERPVIVDVKPMSFPLHPHPFPPTDQNSDDDVAHPCWWGPEGPTYHTVREMKLLYLWMFLLRISEQGPSTRSKRGLSSFTHLSGPRATTVAALGRFNSRAISPGGGRGGVNKCSVFSWEVTKSVTNLKKNLNLKKLIYCV